MKKRLKFSDVYNFLEHIRTKEAKLHNQLAIFKIRAYTIAINKIKDEYKPNMYATVDRINALGLTRSMKDKIIAFVSKGIPHTPVDSKPSIQEVAFANLKPETAIPRSISSDIMKILTKYPNTTAVGSYRRNTRYNSDLDIVITSNATNTLSKYIKWIYDQGLYPYIYSKGNSKMSMIINHKNKAYKVDVFRCPPNEKATMILYSTGSKNFNIRMRSNAKKKGYLLNQHGIYKDGEKIRTNSENDVFDVLGMTYVEPENRI